MQLLKTPIILALDVDDRDKALSKLKPISSLLGAIKIGPRLVNKYGASLVQDLAKMAPVFIDNKYFDIPSTMVAAVRQCFEAGATLVTVHALSGHEALTQLAILEKELNQIRPFKVLAVTILTSWNEQSFPRSIQPWTVDQHVRSLAEEVKSSGLSGLVCSAQELKKINDLNLFTVTPGIRIEKATDDQKRVMTPKAALAAGASALVIGRPILQADNPEAFIEEIISNL